MAITVHDNIVAISYLDSIKIHCLSFLWGLWTLFKQVIIRVLYKKKSDFRLRSGRPPPFLMDTSFGQHLYVKLKVRVPWHYWSMIYVSVYLLRMYVHYIQESIALLSKSLKHSVLQCKAPCHPAHVTINHFTSAESFIKLLCRQFKVGRHE